MYDIEKMQNIDQPIRKEAENYDRYRIANKTTKPADFARSAGTRFHN
jgi:hypothetical protein